MSKTELHEKAVRLSEGGAVWFISHRIRAVEVIGDVDPCDLCEMDCICHEEMAELCKEVDQYDGKKHCLKLVTLKKKKYG